jgi:PAS domain S-box-containing protein
MMAEASPEVFWMSTAEGDRVIYISPSYEKIFGQDPEALFQDPTAWVKIIHPDDRERVLSIVSSAGIPEFQFECRIIRPDGQCRWIGVRGSAITNQQGAILYYAGITEDITEKKQAEEERRVYEDRLMRSQKLEAIGTLAGGIAHDFNNILSAIIGYSELAQDDLPGESPARESIVEVLKAGERARDLVRQILTFSRQMDTESRPVKADLIIKEALKLLRSSIPSTITMNTHIDATTGSVRADPTHIHQIIMNLCTNAYHAMLPGGGELTVTLDETAIDQEFASRYPPLAEGRAIRIAVRDTGTGMDEKTMKRIFDPFFTTKEKGKGTGLGLAMVHGIVTGLGGAVIVHSAPGQGSTFEVYLPVFRGTAPEPEDEEEILLPGRGEAILLVDDEEAILQFSKTMLDQFGYRITTFSSSTEALQCFRSSPDTFDLVITDQTMPGMTGYALASEILKIRSIPIILMTGYSETITPEEALARGVDEYLEKPFTKNALIHAIQRCLRERE